MIVATKLIVFTNQIDNLLQNQGSSTAKYRRRLRIGELLKAQRVLIFYYAIISLMQLRKVLNCRLNFKYSTRDRARFI